MQVSIETTDPIEQKAGWQVIFGHFARHVAAR